MVKREDLLKIFFVYLCLFHVTPAHPCGRNPLSRFQPLARKLGRNINSLLTLLRQNNPQLYQQVQDEWRRYADCVGLVDTGYFKRSGGLGNVMGPRVPATFQVAQGSRLRQDRPMSASSVRGGLRLLRMMRSLAAPAGAGTGAGAGYRSGGDGDARANGL